MCTLHLGHKEEFRQFAVVQIVGLHKTKNLETIFKQIKTSLKISLMAHKNTFKLIFFVIYISVVYMAYSIYTLRTLGLVK